jgi:hypothetical protein
MSDVAAAAPAAAASETPAAATTGAQGDTNQAAGGKDSAAKAKAVAEQMEELTIGSVKAKVPASVAKAIKELERGAQGKMQEAAQAKKQAQEFVKWAASSPKDFLRKTGIDPYDFAEATLAEKIKLMQETPEQKEARELREENKRYKESEKERQDREAKERQDREFTEASQKFNQEFVEAWQNSGLPPDKYFGQLMAAEILSHNKKTGEHLSPKEAASKIKARFQTQARGIFDNATPEAIVEVLGDAIVKKLREHELKKVSTAAPTPNSSARPGHAPATESKKPNKPMNEEQWREYMAKL